MAFSLLTNISSMVAQNQLAMTGAQLERTLYRLSSGSRINSGADDAAGLAIADGLKVNITALKQSARNANDGIGSLQVADGSLAQVTNMLNRAVTLATESANGTVSAAQRTALNSEFGKILTQIDNIGNNTTFNGTAVFRATALSIFMSDSNTVSTVSATTGTLSAAGLGLGTYAKGSFALVDNPTAADTVTIGATTYTFVAAVAAAGDVLIGSNVNDTLQNLKAAINADPALSGLAYGAGTTANADVQATAVNGNAIGVQALVSGVGGNAIAVGDSLTGGGGWADAAATLSGATGAALDLLTDTSAQTALTAINAAVASTASTRGLIGAVINQLQSSVAIMSNQVENLTSAENGIRAADIAEEVGNMSRFQILSQTGIAALAQANSSQQAVLRLLQ